MLARHHDSHRAHVLFIDGHDNERRFYARKLGDCSPQHTIVEAEDGRSGLDIVRSSRIDCVVLDLDLRDICPFEVLGNLLAPGQKREIAVIVLTNQRDPLLLDRARREGAASCLVKSVTSGYLLSRVIQKAVYVVGGRETRPS
jgi:CheY-like chemotaxis protein